LCHRASGGGVGATGLAAAPERGHNVRMPPRSPKAQLWQKLVDEAGEALVEEAAAVSVAQAEKELAEAGFDVAAERARAEDFLTSLAAGAAEDVEGPKDSKGSK
jgi:hypothetical protein